MKKVLAILLVLVFTVSLFACSSSDDSTTSPGTSEDTTGAPTSDAPLAVDVAPAAGMESFPDHGPVGWFTDDVDWFAREPYKIAYLTDFDSATSSLFSDGLENWSRRLNFEYQSYNANYDADAFINTMGVLAQQGYTGMILNPDMSYFDRVKQAADEYGISWLPGFFPMLDDFGNPMTAQGSLGIKYQADLLIYWLRDNYKTFLGDIDESKIGLISTTLSNFPVLRMVSEFCVSDFQELFPLAAANAYEAGVDNFGVDANAGYDVIAPIVAAHPEVEYWFNVGSLEDVVQGGVRAIDAAGLGSKSIAISTGANLLQAAWQSGADTGSYKAGVYYSMEIFAEPLICGVIAMLDGRATLETLWPEWKDPAQPYPVVTTACAVLTVDNYAAYNDYVDAYLTAVANKQTPPTWNP